VPGRRLRGSRYTGLCGAPGSLVGNGSPDRRGGAGGVRTVEIVVLLVAVATVVAAFAGRLRVPAPSLLVAAGLMVGLLPGAPVVHVPPAVVSLVVLPPLLYAASEELPWRDLRAIWRPVVVLAAGLVLASAAAVAGVAAAAASLPVSMAFVLGAVLASTDPVAVSALARRLSLPPRVQALVQAESLFNDGTSLVLFQIAVSLAVGGTATMTATGALLHGVGQFAALWQAGRPRRRRDRGGRDRGARADHRPGAGDGSGPAHPVCGVPARRDVARNAELSRLSTPAPSTRPSAGGCSGTWTWRPSGSPKGSSKRKATGSALPPAGTADVICGRASGAVTA
jgi:Sodium/hydrogen exchanger family